MVNIRNSAKALIIRDGQLLMTKNQDEEGYFYLLPGGGQEHGENLRQTLQRECVEEVGLEVEVGDLQFIREYIGKNHEYAEEDQQVHQIEFIFTCTQKDPNAVATNGSNPDDVQIGVEWVTVEELLKYRLYPQALRQQIIQLVREGTQSAVYLGDIN